MDRWVVLLALVGCEPPTAPADRSEVARAWVYPPAPTAWPLGEVTARIGRSQPPQRTALDGITGEPMEPLRLATPWPVPGGGAARAIVYGLDGGRHAIELIEIDRGRVAWRDEVACAAPVVGVTAQAIVCADARGVRAVGLDGKLRWHSDATFIAITDERVVVAGAGESIILDADGGDELARVKLPANVTSDSVIASCGDAGRELFAVGPDGKLGRVAEAKGGPRLAWSVLVGTVAGIDACDGSTILVTAATDAGTALVAIARDTGKLVGRVDRVRGSWPARDDVHRIEVATDAGVASWPRDLSTATTLALPGLGELLAKRGERRLVRATPLTAALLDRDGVRAFVPLAELGAVLGDDSIIAASWLGSTGETVHRLRIPPPWRHVLRVHPRRAPVSLAAELRDLPRPHPLDSTAAITRADTAMYAIAAVALDPLGPALYAATLEQAPDDRHSAGITWIDLRARAAGWSRADGCGPGTPIGIAIARDVVACAARDSKASTVSAASRDGQWTWQKNLAHVDAIEAAGDVVVVHDADRVLVLDAHDGRTLGNLESDDGAAMRVAALDLAGGALVVTYERGRVVARVPRVGMAPAWSIAVAGVVRALAPAGDGVLVELEDGDAYRIDARTAQPVAIPGIDLLRRAAGDLVTGQAAGGPVPPDRMPIAPPVIPRPAPVRDVPENPPPIATPWQTPPGLAESWQYTLYELDGSLRARNDYALPPPILPAVARGPGDSPLVIEYGAGLRDVIVLDPRRGDPLGRVVLPEDAPSGLVFSTVVDGRPVAGTILAAPLRVVVF